MKVVQAIANLALRAATVGLIAGVTFLILLTLHLWDVPLRDEPVAQVLAIACMVSWRLYRGSTPIEEIRRFLYICGPTASVGLRSNKRWGV